MKPLAERMRPTQLSHFAGQKHLLGSGQPLRLALASGRIHSMILWGPPGVGKTTLAHMMAVSCKREFHQLSAADSGIKSVREVMEKARELILRNQPSPILFLDEIHRFSKSQQDSLLSGVEKGIIILVGATTENPSFELNPALLSRCRVYRFNELEKDDLDEILLRALKEDPELAKYPIEIRESRELMLFSGGDVRKLLNALEAVVEVELSKSEKNIVITDEMVGGVLRQKNLPYDKTGDKHYDTISAFIKSIRGSDPNAALFYLHRMLEGGEDIKFICRRMIISASEDIGLANPNALLLATSCFQAATICGLPEASIPMSQTAIYLACSPKSNSAYLAMHRAKKAARENQNAKIPLHLRNATDKLTAQLGFGKNYKYPHDFPGNYTSQQYSPEGLDLSALYQAGENPFEQQMLEKLEKIKSTHESPEK